MSLKDAKQFVAHYVTGEYTPNEYATFLRWLGDATTDELNEIADEHEALHERWYLSGIEPTPEWIAVLEGKLDKVVEEKVEVPVRNIGVSRFSRPMTWVAAASVVILMSTGAVLWYTQRNEHERSIINEQVPALSQSLVTQRGEGLKQVLLADGSKVWLNAASTLKYPMTFSGSQRVVELSGEAFFEIAPNADKPFRVLIKDAEVAVLGTHFNIMAYDDEPVSRTTLIDGAVRMESGTKQLDLRPGQQAEITYPSPGVEGKIRVISGVDPDVVLGWRSGSLDFRNADLYTVMRAVSRCYNVQVHYSQNLPEVVPFTGALKRQDSLPHVLKQLEGFLHLHFNNDGNNVTVTR